MEAVPSTDEQFCTELLEQVSDPPTPTPTKHIDSYSQSAALVHHVADLWLFIVKPWTLFQFDSGCDVRCWCLKRPLVVGSITPPPSLLCVLVVQSDPALLTVNIHLVSWNVKPSFPNKCCFAHFLQHLATVTRPRCWSNQELTEELCVCLGACSFLSWFSLMKRCIQTNSSNICCF